MTGAVGQRRVPRSFMEGVQLPIPPLNEQRRIVEKLDALTARSRRANEALEAIPPLLERYRQSVLAAAFRGDLTAEWREEHRSAASERQAEPWVLPSDGPPHPAEAYSIDLSAHPLPPGWFWTSVGQCGVVTSGLTKNAKRNSLPRRAPYLRVANVYANELRLDDVAEIGVTSREFGKVRLRKNDLLVVEGNGSLDQIGRVALWDGSIEGCAHQNHLIRARFAYELLAKLALHWLLSPLGRRFIQQIASSTSGLHTLSLSKVSALPMPVMPIPEAKVIVAEIEQAERYLTSIGRALAATEAQIGRLDQAILAKAFRGELVPQDPNDEPASVLLERIRRERGEEKSRPRRHRSRGRRPAEPRLFE